MNSKPNFIWNIARNLFSAIDNIGYTLLTFVYKIFYNISTATIISGDLIRNFYYRVQLILGILMIFKLSMSIINIIINPDSIKDQKQGTSKIVIRVVASLFMLTLIVPVNIDTDVNDKSSLNAYINDHGILFGFLYKFQNSVLQENIIGKLILGSSMDEITTDESIDINSLSDVGGTMSLSVLKAFMRPNVYDENEPYCTNDENSEEPCPNIKCPTEVYDAGYTDDTMKANYLLDSINVKCTSTSGTVYAFDYTPFLGLVASIIMSIMVLGFTLDIAVRAIKLAVLRLVAPIPIISYIDPKSDKDGAFGNWTKSLISTYIDLFLRLAIIYFGAFIIQNLLSIQFPDSGNGLINGLSIVTIIIGVLIFMKQAPKFIKDMLGIKGQPMSNFGLSGLLGGAAMAIGGGGLAGFGLGMMQGLTASSEASAQGKAFSPFNSWSQNRDQLAVLRTGDKNARGGIVNKTQLSLKGRMANRYGLNKANVDKAEQIAIDRATDLSRLESRLALSRNRLQSLGIGPNYDPSSDPIPIAPTAPASTLPDISKYTDPHGTYLMDGYTWNSEASYNKYREDKNLYDNEMKQYQSEMNEYQIKMQRRNNRAQAWQENQLLEHETETMRSVSQAATDQFEKSKELFGGYTQKKAKYTSRKPFSPENYPKVNTRDDDNYGGTRTGLGTDLGSGLGGGRRRH